MDDGHMIRPHEVLQVYLDHKDESINELLATNDIQIFHRPDIFGSDLQHEAFIVQAPNGEKGIFLKHDRDLNPEHTEYVLWHEIWHVLNHDNSANVMYYDELNMKNSNEYPANIFAFFALVPQIPVDDKDLMATAKSKGITFEVIKEVLYRLHLDPLTKHYYDAYDVM